MSTRKNATHWTRPNGRPRIEDRRLTAPTSLNLTLSRWKISFWVYLFFFSRPALFDISGVTQSAELHRGGIHDDVTEPHADHVVVVVGANADAVQTGQRHHQLLPGHGAAIGVLPFILKQGQLGSLKCVFVCIKAYPIIFLKRRFKVIIRFFLNCIIIHK